MTGPDDMTERHDCGADAAAYVLGALDAAEADAFRKHLEGCAVCRDEVDAHERVVHALAETPPQRPAPAGLRRRVMAAARTQSTSSAPRRSVIHVRPWLRLRPAVWATGVAAAAVLVVVLALVPGSSSRVIHAQVSGIAGTAQLRVANDRGELIVHRLSPPPAGDIYEVWLKPPRATPAPAGVLFSVTARGSADLKLPASLRGISQVMVTPEPNGGSPVPTHSPVIVATLS